MEKKLKEKTEKDLWKEAKRWRMNQMYNLGGALVLPMMAVSCGIIGGCVVGLSRLISGDISWNEIMEVVKNVPVPVGCFLVFLYGRFPVCYIHILLTPRITRAMIEIEIREIQQTINDIPIEKAKKLLRLTSSRQDLEKSLEALKEVTDENVSEQYVKNELQQVIQKITNLNQKFENQKFELESEKEKWQAVLVWILFRKYS